MYSASDCASRRFFSPPHLSPLRSLPPNAFWVTATAASGSRQLRLPSSFPTVASRRASRDRSAGSPREALPGRRGPQASQQRRASAPAAAVPGDGAARAGNAIGRWHGYPPARPPHTVRVCSCDRGNPRCLGPRTLVARGLFLSSGGSGGSAQSTSLLIQLPPSSPLRFQFYNSQMLQNKIVTTSE